MLGKWSSRQGKALGNYCSLECHGMTKALGFWLLCGSMTTSIHFFFPGVLRANVSSSWEVLTFQIYSTLFNLGVVLSGILSAQILAASVTPFVSKRESFAASDPKTLNAGGNQLKKRISFTHKNTTIMPLLFSEENSTLQMVRSNFGWDFKILALGF